MLKTTIALAFLSIAAFANPYPDPNAVSKDHASDYLKGVKDYGLKLDPQVLRNEAIQVIRVDVTWSDPGDKFIVDKVALEASGTEALLRRSTRPPKIGSFIGTFNDPTSGAAIYYDTTGTGKEMRYLTRAFTFRFPVPNRPLQFRLTAEDAKSGEMREVLTHSFDPATLTLETPVLPSGLEVRLVKAATVQPAIALNVYAEGYNKSAQAAFFQDAKAVSEALVKNQFPGQEQMEIKAIFFASQQPLGDAESLALPVPERDSFLGLYFPYWHKFGRWYHIVYPTREQRFRRAIGLVPYDYPLAVVDNSGYWGVGNFNELTAIPSKNSSFTYLLLHEFGHYFGLNEEYEGGGPTELAFAPNINEPWSQNITFLKNPSELKWKSLIAAGTPVPTPSSHWKGSGPYGAYRGGYADSAPTNKSHKPGLNCVMKSGTKFCPICHAAILEKIKYDGGN